MQSTILQKDKTGAQSGPMKTQTAITLAKGRNQLAEILGVAAITTYRWPLEEKLPAKHLHVLRLARPRWFKPVAKKP
jgi:hypothetical protein